MVVVCLRLSQSCTHARVFYIVQQHTDSQSELNRAQFMYFGELELPWFEAKLIHRSDCSDEVVLGVLGSIFPFLQDCSNYR